MARKPEPKVKREIVVIKPRHNFAEALDDAINEAVANDVDMDSIISDLELKIMALKEEQE